MDFLKFNSDLSCCFLSFRLQTCWGNIGATRSGSTCLPTRGWSAGTPLVCVMGGRVIPGSIPFDFPHSSIIVISSSHFSCLPLQVERTVREVLPTVREHRGNVRRQIPSFNGCFVCFSMVPLSTKHLTTLFSLARSFVVFDFAWYGPISKLDVFVQNLKDKLDSTQKEAAAWKAKYNIRTQEEMEASNRWWLMTMIGADSIYNIGLEKQLFSCFAPCQIISSIKQFERGRGVKPRANWKGHQTLYHHFNFLTAF